MENEEKREQIIIEIDDKDNDDDNSSLPGETRLAGRRQYTCSDLYRRTTTYTTSTRAYMNARTHGT